MVRLILIVALATIAAGAAGALMYGAHQWNQGTEALRDELLAARKTLHPQAFDPAELDGLPVPVQRYFRAALRPGQPMVALARLEHTGTFNMSESSEQWNSFTSTQLVVTRRPGFDWDGRIAMLPGLNVHVHDAYINGKGILRASLAGLFRLADMPPTPALAEGELMRFLAEAAWYPTALLPSQGVRWEAVGNITARATLTDGDTTVNLLFEFDDDGLIGTVRAEARGRMVDGKVVPTPWQGRFWNYEERNGMRIPLEGEVSWVLPEGEKPYWRGRVTRIEYEPATPG
ncbi:hypothetical protein GCM10027343_25310 [Noviherbaspirillum agri]